MEIPWETTEFFIDISHVTLIVRFEISLRRQGTARVATP